MNALVEISLVAVGGALGATMRFLASRWYEEVAPSTQFPAATLGVNILGCLLIGLIAGLTTRLDISPAIRLLLVTGILGGFTTFSAFGLEAVSLLRAGNYPAALLYISASVVGGCGAVAIGLYLSGWKNGVNS